MHEALLNGVELVLELPRSLRLAQLLYFLVTSFLPNGVNSPERNRSAVSVSMFSSGSMLQHCHPRCVLLLQKRSALLVEPFVQSTAMLHPCP